MKTFIQIVFYIFFIVFNVNAQNNNFSVDGDVVSICGKLVSKDEILKNNKLVTNNTEYKVVHFVVSGLIDKTEHSIISNSENISNEIKAFISKISTSHIFIENIWLNKVGVDTLKIPARSCIIKIK